MYLLGNKIPRYKHNLFNFLVMTVAKDPRYVKFFQMMKVVSVMDRLFTTYLIVFLCVLVLCTQVNDVCDVTLSVHPHRAS